jgi:hypothetical protein
VITVSGKGSGRVSVAGPVCLRPDTRGHLFYRVRIHHGRKGERRSMSEADYAGLIRAGQCLDGNKPLCVHIGREDGEQSFRHAACFRCSAVVWA